jgi:hypothetical protein
LHADAAAKPLGVENLDDRFSPQQGLLAAIHRSKTALPDPLAEDEPSYLSPGQVVLISHRRRR